jgi:hypothetical protein
LKFHFLQVFRNLSFRLLLSHSNSLFLYLFTSYLVLHLFIDLHYGSHILLDVIFIFEQLCLEVFLFLLLSWWLRPVSDYFHFCWDSCETLHFPQRLFYKSFNYNRIKSTFLFICLLYSFVDGPHIIFNILQNLLIFLQIIHFSQFGFFSYWPPKIFIQICFYVGSFLGLRMSTWLKFFCYLTVFFIFTVYILKLTIIISMKMSD